MKKVNFYVLIVLSVMMVTTVSCNKNNTGKINVTVENNFGYVENATVKLKNDDGSTIQTLQTDSKGIVKFKDVLQGTYYVRAVYNDDSDYSDSFQVIAGKTKDVKLFID